VQEEEEARVEEKVEVAAVDKTQHTAWVKGQGGKDHFGSRTRMTSFTRGGVSLDFER
jgi:hypothetical protein